MKSVIQGVMSEVITASAKSNSIGAADFAQSNNFLQVSFRG